MDFTVKLHPVVLARLSREAADASLKLALLESALRATPSGQRSSWSHLGLLKRTEETRSVLASWTLVLDAAGALEAGQTEEETDG